jgi:hypothetical protein
MAGAALAKFCQRRPSTCGRGQRHPRAEIQRRPLTATMATVPRYLAFRERGAAMKAHRGEEIVCDCGRVAGSFRMTWRTTPAFRVGTLQLRCLMFLIFLVAGYARIAGWRSRASLATTGAALVHGYACAVS